MLKKIIKRRERKIASFENAITEAHNIHLSRYGASWINAGGTFRTGRDIRNFRNWLESLELTEDEIVAAVEIATTGKLELEASAEEFMKEH